MASSVLMRIGFVRAAIATIAALAPIACGTPEPPPTLELDPARASCFTATRRVLDVLPDGDDVWLATEGGLLRLSVDGELRARYTRADGLVSNALRALALAPDGSLWIATDDGLARLVRGRFEHYTSRNGLNDDRTYAVAVDRRGAVLVGTERGVARLAAGRFTPLADTHEFSRRATYAIHPAADGSVWFAKENALTRWSGGSTWEVFQRDPLIVGPRSRLISNTVRAVASDPAGRPWIGTHEGLGLLDTGGWKRWAFAERFFSSSGPGDNHVATVAVDADGWVWIGHGDSGDHAGGKGAARFLDDTWEYFSILEGLPDNRVHRIRAAADGAVWLATGGGVARHRAGRFDSWAVLGDLPANHVLGLHKNEDGRIIVETASGSATFAHGERVQMRISAPRPIAAAAAADPTDSRATPTEVRQDGPAFIPSGVEVRGADGSRWVGTRRHGLWRNSGDGWVELRLGDRGFPRHITSLLFEDERTIWVGTVTEGAIRFDLTGSRGPA